MRKSLFPAILLYVFFFMPACGSRQQNIRRTDETQKISEGAAALQNKIRKNPADPHLRAQLGILFLRAEQYNTALAQFDSALMLQPEMPTAKFGRAEANFLAGQTRSGMKGYLDVLNSLEAERYAHAIAERIGAPYAIRPITFSPGENMMARFSADGRFIVFQSNRDGNWEIYRALPDGAQPFRLTDDPAADEAPCFSPDGQWIAFARAQSKTTREIYLLNIPALENPVCISRHAADDWNPAFSPKGDCLAFVSDRDDISATDTQEKQSDIFLFSLTDSSLARFTQGPGNKSAPCFTPDGAALVYASNVNGIFDIFEQPLGGAAPVNLVSKNGSKGGPQVSPDGRRMVYFEKRDDNLDLFLFDRERQHVQRLTNVPGVDAFPAFSPDGHEIFFTSNRGSGYQIYALDLRVPISRDELIAVLEQLLEQPGVRRSE
jgi:TolB protein